MINKTKYRFSSLKWLIALITLLPIVSCNPKKDERSDKVILKIGNIEITDYEFERDNRFYDPNSKISKKDWIANYVDDTYLLADAYDKKFDTISSINKMVQHRYEEKISEVDGYVWDILEKPKFGNSDVELKEAYLKCGKEFVFSGLLFPSKELLRKYIANNENLNEKTFEQLTQVTKGDKKIVSFNHRSFRWPFLQVSMYKNKIELLNESQVIGPLETIYGYFILHLDRKNEVKQAPFKDVKTLIDWQLTDAKKEAIIFNSQKEVLKKTEAVINETEVYNLSMALQKNKIDSVDKEMCGKVLMTFKLDGKMNRFTVGGYREYIMYMFMTSGDDKSMEIINQNLINYLNTVYLLRVADSLGIPQDKWVQLDKKSFKNRMLKDYYVDHELKNNEPIKDSEIEDYYLKHKESFAGSKVATVSFLEFRDIDTAHQNLQVIYQIVNEGKLFNLKDTSIIRGLLAYKPNLRIESTAKDYPQELTDIIFSLQEKQVSMPLKYNDRFIVFFVTKRDGARIKDLREVKNEILATIEREKLKKVRNARLMELKKKYTLITNLLQVW